LREGIGGFHEAMASKLQPNTIASYTSLSPKKISILGMRHAHIKSPRQALMIYDQSGGRCFEAL
jgi:hypothetical protein